MAACSRWPPTTTSGRLWFDWRPPPSGDRSGMSWITIAWEPPHSSSLRSAGEGFGLEGKDGRS